MALKGPFTVEEVREILVSTLHGPLPKDTTSRIFSTLAKWAQIVEKQEAEETEKRKSEVVTVLPDGSGFFTASYPLPKDHWLYDECSVPPITYRIGESDPERNLWEDRVRRAVKYAVQAATMSGKEMDFDPDALVQNAIVGMLGYHTESGYSDSPCENPPKKMERIGKCACGMVAFGVVRIHEEKMACPEHGGPKVEFFKDGDQWCAVVEGFTNLQECTAGFGDDKAHALWDLEERLHDKCRDPV